MKMLENGYNIIFYITYFMFVQNEFKVTERDFTMKEVTKALKENRVRLTCTHLYNEVLESVSNLVCRC